MRERERKATPVESVDMKGNIPPGVAEWLAQRSRAFQRATQGKGKPMSYGHGNRDKK